MDEDASATTVFKLYDKPKWQYVYKAPALDVEIASVDN